MTATQITQIVWSVGLIGVPAAIYWFIVRPRLKTKFTDLYAHIDGFWERWLARAYAFRTMLIGTVGVALPEIINASIGAVDAVAKSDISFLSLEWQNYIRVAALIATMLSRAIATAPHEEPPKG